jgi:hypothetical protein
VAAEAGSRTRVAAEAASRMRAAGVAEAASRMRAAGVAEAASPMRVAGAAEEEISRMRARTEESPRTSAPGSARTRWAHRARRLRCPPAATTPAP